MPTFYSPSGNPEIWEEKPDNYFTQEEWDAAHPPPEPEPPTPEEQFAQAKQAADAALAKASAAPVEVPLPEGTWFYNGGDGSASAILGAVTLAEALGETTVTLWDHDNVLRDLSIESAMIAAVAIAKIYREAGYERARKIAAAKAAMEAEMSAGA